jgi:predicted O-methyltransferase YrrM
MAEWTQEQILSLARNFMESRILLTAAQANLFTILSEIPKSVEDLVEPLTADRRALTILLDALAAIGLLSKERGKYFCEPSVSNLLSERGAQTVLPMVLHAGNLWTRWSNLNRFVSARQVGEATEQDGLSAFIGAMHAIAVPQADWLVSRINPGSARKLLDVGGASGTYTMAFLRASLQLSATLYDRPPVIEMARERLTREGWLDRVTLAAGDFSSDPLPAGHDLAFLSAIIHQNSPEQNLALYKKLLKALEPGGRLVIRDHILNSSRTQPRAGAIFAVNMLVGTEGGNCYTLAEIEEGLNQAGYVRIRLLQEDTRMDGLLEAFKP